jgi:hypothetical protein
MHEEDEMKDRSTDARRWTCRMLFKACTIGLALGAIAVKENGDLNTAVCMFFGACLFLAASCMLHD